MVKEKSDYRFPIIYFAVVIEVEAGLLPRLTAVSLWTVSIVKYVRSKICPVSAPLIWTKSITRKSAKEW